MNLNFYPNGYNDISNNYDYAYNNLQNLQNKINNNLQEFKNIQNTVSPINQQEQQYVLVCGKKDEWDEFLELQYGLTEYEIFNKYKLYLQAKQEVLNEQGQNELDNMKNKIKNRKGSIDGSIKSNIKPKYYDNTIFDGSAEQLNMGDSVESNNGPVEQGVKQNNRATKKQTKKEEV